MKKLAILTLVLLLLVGCTQPAKDEKFTASTLDAGFDTFISLVGYTTSQEKFNEYFDFMKSELNYYHKLYDKYHNYDGINNIKTINDNAGVAPVEVEKPLIDMLVLAKKYNEITDGYFNITMGATMRIWHQYRENGMEANSIQNFAPPVPTIEELTASFQYSGWDNVVLDEENNTVFITNPNISIDVGGIAKGYAIELVALTLEENGLVSGAINGGGNVRIIGSKPDGTGWTIGVTNPDNPNGESVSTFVNEQGTRSYVTSGDYQRFFMSNGIRYGHLINPKTLFPATHCRSVTVVTKDSGLADILSTALFVMGYEQGEQFVKEYNSKYPDDQIGALWVFEEDQVPETVGTVLEINGFFVVVSGSVINEVKQFEELIK